MKGGVKLKDYEENGLGLEGVSEVMTDYTEQESDDEEQKKAYEGYLQLDEDVAEELSEVEQSSEMGEDYESIEDDELERVYEKILETDEAERTEEQSALLEQTKERYLKIKFYREFESASRWFETEYPDRDFVKTVNSNEFLEFAAGVKLPIRELVRRYVNMYERYEKRQPPISSGSVKTSGKTMAKDYFSPAEVRKMSEEEIEKNLETIKKSMRKWK